MKFWKNMKRWQKVVAVIVAVFLLHACFGGKSSTEEPQRHTTTAQAVAVEGNRPDPSPPFLVDQKDKNVIMRFECADPSIKGSGFKFVYRDHAGKILENSGYQTYWAVTDNNSPIKNNDWTTLEATPIGKYPKPDAFLLLMWEMRDKLNSKDHPTNVVFTVAKSRAEASRSASMTLGGATMVHIAAAANINPCFILTGK